MAPKAVLIGLPGSGKSTIGPVHRVYHCAAIMPLGKLLEQDNATVHRIMSINYGGLVIV